MQLQCCRCARVPSKKSARDIISRAKFYRHARTETTLQLHSSPAPERVVWSVGARCSTCSITDVCAHCLSSCAVCSQLLPWRIMIQLPRMPAITPRIETTCSEQRRDSGCFGTSFSCPTNAFRNSAAAPLRGLESEMYQVRFFFPGTRIPDVI